MARARKAATVQKKLHMICYGQPFSGKSTFASQLAYMHNEDGNPMRVLYIDAESGSIDNYLDSMEANGIDLGNIFIVYTQSLGEVLDYIEKVKNNDDFYELDDDGMETDEIVTDSQGKPFRADAIVIDGVSVLYTAAQQGLLEFSKKRARVKANKKELVGDEKMLMVEGASLEIKDWGSLKYKGANLCLSLLGTGVHSIITCREDEEKVSIKDEDGKISSIATGKKIPAGFKTDLNYNMHTVIHFYRDDDGEVCADVEKDRTGVHPGDTLVEPQLLDWQIVIDKSKGKQKFVLNNSLDTAVETEQEIYSAEVMSNATKSFSKSDMEKSKQNTEAAEVDDDVTALQAKVKGLISKLDPVAKNKMKTTLKENGLPTAIGKVTDISILNQILETISQ